MAPQPAAPAAELIEAVGGSLGSGQIGVLHARPGVGKSVVLAHLAIEALRAGAQVLHVTLSDDLAHVRARYDEVWRQATGEGRPNAEVERRRLVLSYAGRSFEVAHLGAQLRMLISAGAFRPDLVVLDGLDSAQLLTGGPQLAALVRDLRLGAWCGLTAEEVDDDTLSWASALVELCATEQGMGLRVRAADTRVMLAWAPDATSATRAGAKGVVMSGSEQGRPSPSACTLYSGGASGSEAAFGEAAARHGVREVHFTFEGHKQARTEGSKELSARELEAGDVSLVYVSRRLHRTYNEHGLIRKILQTLWHMVSRSQQIFVIGAIQTDGTVVGGTGWSVELARMWRKELWVYDQERSGWFSWDGETWVPGTATITAAQICGTGTRYLEPNGQAAIDDLFARAFGA